MALLSESWPIGVERRVLPGVAREAFLVAELKNPSSRVLPGGPANLFVGADPAGTASLKVMAPGELTTLPLGIDRAITADLREEVREVPVGTKMARCRSGRLQKQRKPNAR